MENDSQRLAYKTDQIFHIVYDKIFSYLDVASLTQTLSVSTDFFILLNKYFKHFLITNNLIEPNDIQVSGDHYLKLFRAFYSREVLVTDLSLVTKTYDEIRFVRYPRCSTYGVKDFNMGIKFTVFHLYDNSMIFLKTEEYTNPSFDMKTLHRLNIRHNVAKFDLKARHLFYLTFTGQLHVIFYNEDRPSTELSEGILEFTIQQPLKDFSVSYNYAVLFIKVPEEENPNNSEAPEMKNENSPVKKKMLHDIRSLDLHALAPEDFNAPLRVRKIQGLDYTEVLSFCVGNITAYFIVENNVMFECSFSLVNNGMFMASIYEPLKDKLIKNIWSGPNFFFAFEQMELDSIDNWSQVQILQWIRDKDFHKYYNIIKYDNITGKDLLNADKQFLENKLGMKKETIKRFLEEIGSVSKKTLNKPKLYGWGSNNFGQLGVNTGNLTINTPVDIPLPAFDKDDQIVHLECGWKASAFMTLKGNVWLTEPIQKKVVVEDEDKQSKKKKKDASEVSGSKEGEKGEKGACKWADITPIFQRLKEGIRYRIVKISFSKEKFAALGANMGYKTKSKGQGVENKTSFSKFKGADYVLNRIAWDSHLKPEEFVVGYEDRFLGFIEVPFQEFSLKTDIPSQRIRFIKRSGEVVWDRRLKLIKI